jgi:hypothetical protein
VTDLPVQRSLGYEVSKSRFTRRNRRIKAGEQGLRRVLDIPPRPPVATGSARPVRSIVRKIPAATIGTIKSTLEPLHHCGTPGVLAVEDVWGIAAFHPSQTRPRCGRTVT